MITKKCEVCEKEFSKYPCYFKQRSGRFCSRKCMLDFNSEEWKGENNPIRNYDNSGENNPMWGKPAWNYNPEGNKRKDGYVRVAVNGKRVLKHRLLMEKHLGRPLLPNEVIHHLDGNNENNNIDNLTVITQSIHASHHGYEYHKKRREQLRKSEKR